MSHFDETIDLEGSCSAQLSNLLQMPDRIEIPTHQSGHDQEFQGSNHTTPLNYMRKETPKAAFLRDSLKQMTTHNELEDEYTFEKNSRFDHLVPSHSTQDSFFEFHNSASDPLEALDASNAVFCGNSSRDTVSFGENKWQPEDYGLDLSAGQLGYASNSDYPHHAESRFDGQTTSQQRQQQHMGIASKTETPGLGLLNKASGYLIIGPDGNGFASELDGRRSAPYSPQVHHQEQPPHSLYGAPSSTLYSSAANTPRESWNMQNGISARKSSPASHSALSSYATASTQQPSSMLNKFIQAPPPSAHSLPYNAQGQDSYGPPARSPHYGEEAGRPLYAEQRGVSPKYASSSPARTPTAMVQRSHDGYPPQHAPSGYGSAPGHAAYGHVPAPHHQHQHPQGQYSQQQHPHHHQQQGPPPHHYNQPPQAGYYPPSNHGMPPLQPPVQPDTIFQVQFKRISRCFTNRSGHPIHVRDFVVVEGDRGEDIGVVIEILSMQEFMHRRMTDHRIMGDKDNHTVDCILRLATIHERQQLPDKFHTEKNIIQACNELAMYGFGLPIMVYDAEFQFDRNKLTIYYECNVRIDFRDFVRQLFSTYKARIWMKIGNMNTPLEVQPLAAMALATGVQFSSGGN